VFHLPAGGFETGGIGVLCDLAGDDQYQAGSQGQGAGIFFGLGILDNRTGTDLYSEAAVCIGCSTSCPYLLNAQTSAPPFLLDGDGDVLAGETLAQGNHGSREHFPTTGPSSNSYGRFG
jgi:hypothetical protein